MNKINRTLTEHTSSHSYTKAILQQLQTLPEKIVVLFLAANPLDAEGKQSLRLDEEARSINEMIAKAKHRDSIELITRWAVRTHGRPSSN